MPRKVSCSFCGDPIAPGTGLIFVRKDGVIYNFCTHKCERNMIGLNRKPRKVKWTEEYRKEKALRTKK